MARRGRAFFRTPYGPSKTGVLPNALSLLASPEEAQQRLREAQQRKPEAGQRNPERYQRKTLPRIGPFQWVTTIRRKNTLLPASPGAAARGGSRRQDHSILPWVSDNSAKKKSRSYRVGCCGEGIGEHGGGRADRAIKASWPRLVHNGACPPKAQRIYAGDEAHAKSLATVRLPAGRVEAGLVLAAARRGWPGQARP